MQERDIALIITDLAVGAERCLAELATRLDRGRFRPVVYCLAAAPAAGEDSCLKALETAGIAVHCLAGEGVWHFPAIVRRLENSSAGKARS